MKKIKKVFNLILMSLIINILSSFDAYAVSRDCLRVPIGNYDRINRALDRKDEAVELKRKIDDYINEADRLLKSNPDLELLEGRIHDLITDVQGMRMLLEVLEKDTAKAYLRKIRHLFVKMNKQREAFLAGPNKGVTVLSAQELRDAPIQEIRGYVYIITNGRYLAQGVLDTKNRVTLKVKAVNSGELSVFVASPYERDFNILERLRLSGRHYNIAEVYEVSKDKQYWIRESVDGDDLLEALAKHSLTKKEMVQVFDQLLDAIIWLENIGIYYKDVDMSNLILVKDNKGEITLKLRDFGHEGITFILNLESLKQRMPSWETWRRIERLITPVFEAVKLKGQEKEQIFKGLREKYWTVKPYTGLENIRGQNRGQIRSNL